MPKVVIWSAEDLRILRKNHTCSISHLHHLLPHFSESTIAKQRRLLYGKLAKPSGTASAASEPKVRAAWAWAHGLLNAYRMSAR